LPAAEKKRVLRARLAWRCRRGTKELDGLLSGFLERRFDALDPGLQSSFCLLLEQQDPMIADWLLGRTAPIDSDLGQIIEMIRRDSGIGVKV